MRIGSSQSLFLQNRLNSTTQAIARSLERLSTGKRVNSPRDDVAAYSLSVRLESQIRGLAQANLNINQAMGLVQTASSAMSVQMDIVQQMRELAVQGANGTLSLSDRENINTQLASLMQEFQRITNETQFNGIHLLNGSSDTLSLLTGARAGDNLDIDLPGLSASSAFNKTVMTGNFSADIIESAIDSTLGAPGAYADFNGDGILDYASNPKTGSTASIYLGNGDGTFSAETTLSFGSTGNNSIYESGDINGDGIIDLLTHSNTDDEVGVFLGNGDGTFGAIQTFSSDTNTNGVFLGDMNNDGKLDVVTSNATSQTTSVFLGNGDGTFQAEQAYATAQEPSDFALGDFDGDGNLDAIYTDKVGPNLSVLFGDGNGSFTSETVSSNGAPGGIFVEDLNGDGILDVVAANNSIGAGADTMSVFIGNGDGSFAARVTFSIGDGGNRDIAIADINGDSILDLISDDHTNDIGRVFLGNGDGSFQSASTLTYDDSGDGISDVIDTNGDGLLDLVYFNAALDQIRVSTGLGRDVSALGDINVDDQDSADSLLGILDDTIDKLNTEQTALSNYLNSLEIRANHNLLQSGSLVEAKSRVEDADFALETAELVRLQILQQAQIAALSQSNINLRVVLELFDSL